MRTKLNKPWFRQKGRYADGRKKVCIEWEEDGTMKSKNLPKPERLLAMLRRQDGNKEINKGKGDGIY